MYHLCILIIYIINANQEKIVFVDVMVFV